jgi:hypothetical protein
MPPPLSEGREGDASAAARRETLLDFFCLPIGKTTANFHKDINQPWGIKCINFKDAKICFYEFVPGQITPG